MSASVKQVSFTGGEVTPQLYARTDNAIYEKALRTIRNFIVMRHGGATGRPGTQYVGTTHNGGSQVRLMPFIFNETGLGQSYVLEFGNLYIAFYQNGGVVSASPPTPYTIVSPYAQADLSSLKFAQSADVITVTHHLYPVYEIRRVAATNWTITLIDNSIFVPGVANPVPIAISGTAGAAQFAYCITAVNDKGEESSTITSPYTGGVITTQAAALTKAAVATPVTITWSPSTGATHYRIYYSDATKPGLVTIPNNAWGYIATVWGAGGGGYVDNGVIPDYTQAPPIRAADFNNGAGSYPSTVGYIQQRRVFADTDNNQIGFWMSHTGAFYNFYASIPSEDDDPVLGSIFSDEVNEIEHVLESKFGLILTAGAELYIQGDGSGVITPSSVNASVQSHYGAAAIRPITAGDVTLFIQSLGSIIRDLAFDFAIDGYRGSDITVFASHLFEGYQISDWTYQKVPDSIIWAVRSDGVLLSCTYVREQQVLAWARHDFTNGTVENVCAIPENGQYALYLSIKRVINGSTVRYIERMSSRIWSDPINATYLDCYLGFDGRNTGSTTMTLTASGGFQTGGTAYQQQLTLTSSVSYFGGVSVGNQIFLQDALYVSSQGQEGNQVRLTIQAIGSGTVVTVTPSGAVPAEFQAIATTNWSRAVQTVTGLTHLIGQEVSVWADRFLVGSPLNYHVDTVYTVSGSGTLTLDKPYSVIYVGLPMTQDLEPLDLESYFGETMLARRKRVGSVALYAYNTRSFFCGSENPDNNLQNTDDEPLFQLYEERKGTRQTTYDQPPQLWTDQDYVITPARWSKNGRFFIRNVDPVPVTILGFSAGEEDPSQGTYKRV